MSQAIAGIHRHHGRWVLLLAIVASTFIVREFLKAKQLTNTNGRSAYDGYEDFLGI
ncbi:MAG TPA: hypothetical protein VNN76_08680 [Bacteroidota bacterium]|nr:hypothetical protein [Bacteroidota bacterium]